MIKLISVDCLICSDKDKKISQLEQEIQVLKSEITTLLQKIQNVEKSEELIYKQTWDLLNVCSSNLLSQYIQQDSFQSESSSKFIQESVKYQSNAIEKSSLLDSSTSGLLTQHLLQQMNNQQIKLTCVCLAPLKVQYLKQLLNSYNYNILSDQLFNNQIKELKQKYKEKIRCCKNRFCHFFFISEVELQSYCPLCLQ